MLRFIGKPAHSRIDIRRPQFPQTRTVFSGDQFGERRSGSDGCSAAPNFESALRDTAIFNQRGQAQNIAADGIRNLYGDGGRGKFAHIARVPEVLDQFRAHGLRI